MLIDTTHSEETRVVILDGNRIEEFDFETSTKKQLKGNIYLAKVTRVEPSLQAAFVDYGGGRHGFLAFSEIHPDYYQIPIADREALLEEEAAIHAEGAEEASEPATPVKTAEDGENDGTEPSDVDKTEMAVPVTDLPETDSPETGQSDESRDETSKAHGPSENLNGHVETLGGDEMEEVALRNRPSRNYKIQEVIKRRQILLIQVVKEERGNKGAALTTYLSLAGRYCVLMPNTARGGGISRKITSHGDRKRMRDILKDLSIPQGMGIILRTAGLERTKVEIRRDSDYLVRVWNKVRELTLESTAPALVYEEANLIMRSIRDLYQKDIEEILVDGEEGYRTAKDFMRMLMPSHAKNVQPYKDPGITLFQRYQVEAQLDEIHSQQINLKSGGSIVISPTEALVSIDVNSGRSTKERNIEGTAVKTNQEAAAEVARQLRLRDLGGLIVIDFIDMEEGRHRRQIEHAMKDAMKTDRARIRLGKISAFGLLEMSRQRLRPSLLEASSEVCPHCAGTGNVRSTESTSLHVLRAIEEEGARKRSSEISVFVPTEVALYLLNQKREAIAEIETRHQFRVFITRDDALIPPAYRMERAKTPGGPKEVVVAAETAQAGSEPAKEGRRRGRRHKAENEAPADNAPQAVKTEAEAEEAQPPAEGGDEQARPKRRRRGRRGGRRRTHAKAAREGQETPVTEAEATSGEGPQDEASQGETTSGETTNGATQIAEGPVPQEPVGESAVAQTPIAEASADPAETPAKKPRRRRRAPRKKVKTGEETEATETAAKSELESAPESVPESETESKTKSKPDPARPDESTPVETPSVLADASTSE